MAKIEILREPSSLRGRYVIQLDGQSTAAELTWVELASGTIAVDHTGVPDIYRGEGFGVLLVEHMVADARARGLRVVPICPFVRMQYQRHPDWGDVFGDGA